DGHRRGVRARRPAVRRRPAIGGGPRAAGRGAGLRPAAGPPRPPPRLRPRSDAAPRGARRHQPRAGRRGGSGGLVGVGRVRGRRGDGSAVVAARVDTTPVARWWISDPSQPDQPPAEHAYPAAGTANADVTLWVL